MSLDEGLSNCPKSYKFTINGFIRLNEQQKTVAFVNFSIHRWDIAKIYETFDTWHEYLLNVCEAVNS